MRRHVVRILPFAPDQLFRLVGDVERYPEFVPWLTAIRTWNARDLGDGVDSLDAEATVRFAAIRERFSTRVRRDAGARRIDVTLISGPFRTLANRWSFHEDPAGARVEFSIEFVLKSKLLTKLLSTNQHHAADRLIACFEDRARALYEPLRS